MMGKGRSGCPSFRELMALMDGELPADRRREVQGHLEACPRCRSIVESQKRMEESWRDDYEAPPESGFRSMRKKVLQRDGASSGSRLLRFGLPVAAALIAALVGLRLFVPGAGSLLGTVESPSVSAARRAEETMATTRDESGAAGQVPAGAAGEEMEESAEDDQQQADTSAIMSAEPAEEAVQQEPEASAMDDTLADATEGLSRAGREDADLAGQTGAGEAPAPEEIDESVVGAGSGGDDTVGAGEEESAPMFSPPESVWADREAARQPGEDSLEIVADAMGLSLAEKDEDAADSTVRIRSTTSHDGMIAGSAAPGDSTVMLHLTFDSAGRALSDREQLLDSLAAGWRDSLQGLYADTTITLTLQRILELIGLP
ncbi:MAG: zf-HC2 domain-containing protein [Candidatus Fermentibacteraceae bacterium]